MLQFLCLRGCALQPSLALLVGLGISVTKVALAK